MDLREAAKGAVDDSERWFPDTTYDTFFTAACMAGEIGEVLNLLKKVKRGSHAWEDIRGALEEEVADVFTYLLKLAGEMNLDLETLYHRKRDINEQRFSPTTWADGTQYRRPRLPKQVLAEAGFPVGDVTQTWQTKGETAS
jgi:NTP pyrophosphatase (non-canonical NTP hydrolase)